MTLRDIGPIRGSDESLHHQIVDTFATVSESDHAWTEKIWGSIARTDGTLQVDFGIGKYHNRGIIDGFGGVSRGPEQWTVRASRELERAPEQVGTGPVQYEIVEELRQVRFRLEPNDVQPISFDIVLTGVTPPCFENRNLVRDRRTGRIDVNVIRYHQGGWASETITVDGTTHDVTTDEWFGFRDHSCGVRQGVGQRPGDLMPMTRSQEGEKSNDGGGRAEGRGGMKWAPAFFQRPDGTYYETAIFLAQGIWDYSSAYINDQCGRQDPVRSVVPHLTYHPRTRYVIGGELHLTMDSGDERVIEVEALGRSGFLLRTAGYGHWDGFIHGGWQGELKLGGEYLADCSDDEHLRTLGQLRDTPIRVCEGDAVGYGIMESIITGVWPELGLDVDSDHRVAYS